MPFFQWYANNQFYWAIIAVAPFMLFNICGIIVNSIKIKKRKIWKLLKKKSKFKTRTEKDCETWI
jgi:hypothetical protein